MSAPVKVFGCRPCELCDAHRSAGVRKTSKGGNRGKRMRGRGSVRYGDLSRGGRRWRWRRTTNGVLAEGDASHERERLCVNERILALGLNGDVWIFGRALPWPVESRRTERAHLRHSGAVVVMRCRS